MARELMVDIETLSTKPEATVLTIGAVFFDPVEGNIEKDNACYIKLDWRDQKGVRDVDKNTVDWWKKQDAAIRNETFSGKKTIKEAEEEFLKWLKESNFIPSKTHVWANSPSFDLTILNSLFDYKVPWKYYNFADLRTFFRCMGWPKKKKSPNHRAVDDAIFQCQNIIAVLNQDD